MPETDQRQYELVFILPPQLEEVDLETTKKEIEKTVANFGGTINFGKSEKHNLAYPINKQGQGLFLMSQLLMAPEKIETFLKELKLNKQILRRLINQLPLVKTEVKKAKPKKVIKKIEKKKPVIVKEEKVKLEEIDKKLDKIIEEI
jgi:ribosomal protein S6